MSQSLTENTKIKENPNDQSEQRGTSYRANENSKYKNFNVKYAGLSTMSWESLVELKLCQYVQRVCINMYQNLYIQKGTRTV